MGARKKEFNHNWPSNRNLGKSQLGGVIFGSTNTAINECFLKQLFGLPKEHLEYVGKIDFGLPLFLLNYDDRKLHGVFEAASHGQRDIDPYAWTCEGKQKTHFAAQDNYFTPIRFWFELDHSQTSRLLCLFSSQPVCASLLTTNCSFVSKKVENGLKEKRPCMSFSGLTVNSDTPDEFLGTAGKDEKEPVYMKSKEPAVNCKFWDPPIASEDVATHINVDPHSANCEDMTLETSTSLVEDPIIAQLIEKVEDLMAFKIEQDQKIDRLEKHIIFLQQNLIRLKPKMKLGILKTTVSC